VLGERGHRVVVLEAADVPGGQVRLAATARRRRDLIGIIDWRISEAKHSGVEFRYGVYADAETVLAEDPDVVIVATGGLPNRSFLYYGEDLVTDTWDVMAGTAHPAVGCWSTTTTAPSPPSTPLSSWPPEAPRWTTSLPNACSLPPSAA
jgi:hypothetical protein